MLATVFKRVRNIVAKGGEGRDDGRTLKEEAEKQVGRTAELKFKVYDDNGNRATVRDLAGELGKPLPLLGRLVLVPPSSPTSDQAAWSPGGAQSAAIVDLPRRAHRPLGFLPAKSAYDQGMQR